VISQLSFRLAGVRSFTRFLLVGLLNSAVGYGVFAICLLAGVPPEAALLVATILGVAFNFYTTGRLVFGQAGRQKLIGFLSVYAVIYLLNAASLRLLVFWEMPPLVGQLLLMPCAAIATFLALKKLVFKEIQ
jgi:putative flippase GtrA